jgi:hypothetical protein
MLTVMQELPAGACWITRQPIASKTWFAFVVSLLTLRWSSHSSKTPNLLLLMLPTVIPGW